MEKRLSQADYLAGRDYSIADIATYPWLRSSSRRGLVNLDETPSVARWLDVIGSRPAVERGLALMAEHQQQAPMDDKQREVLFGKTQHEKR
jgi:GST-like protein